MTKPIENPSSGKILSDPSGERASTQKETTTFPDDIPFKWSGGKGADSSSMKTIRQAIKMAGDQYRWLLAQDLTEDIRDSYYITDDIVGDSRSLQYKNKQLIPGQTYFLCLI